uniref:Uncharacterized protein n=1 Tax=Opuntia streptacantha TaxID=393608 RepID=A0A7C9EV57_OPUST
MPKMLNGVADEYERWNSCNRISDGQKLRHILVMGCRARDGIKETGTIVTRIAERLDRRTRYGNGERHFPKKGNEERTSFGTFFGNGIRDFGSLVLKLSLNSKLHICFRAVI